ncbi:MAG: DUF4364 family protein [Clostridiales bacterium]|nr:DUF4364 family protein [Clostridiales bacterium]
MLEDITVMADDKLTILYYIQCLGIPLTNGQITRFFTENTIINYFDLQQYILELVSGGLVNNIETGNLQLLVMTNKGNEALSYFRKRIPPALRNTIESYAEENRSYLKGESQITADYKKIDHNQYEVVCKVTEKDLVLMELKLNIPTSEQAKDICRNWKAHAPKVFKGILDDLV